MQGSLDALTGLRFAAALQVVLLHASILMPQAGWFTALVSRGHVGVDFFFLLSGFVLTWSFRPGSGAVRFWWRRFARLWPLHALMTLVAIPLVAAVPPWGLLAHLSLVHVWVPVEAVRDGLNTPSWSLSVEMFFYALFPLIAMRLPAPHRVPVVMVAVAVGVLAFAALNGFTGLWLNKFPPYRLGEFVLGMLLATAVRAGWRPKMDLRVVAVINVAAYLGVTLAGSSIVVAGLVMAGPLMLLIATVAARDLEGRGGWLSRPAMVMFGRWSFALYLVHSLVLIMLVRAGLDGLPGAVAGVTVSLGLSGVLFVWFERPVERWLRGLPDRRRSGTVAVEPARA